MIELKEQQNYNRTEIRDLLADTFAAYGGIEQLLAGCQNVLLKPNFVVPERPEDCATTHPDVYMALADFLQSKGLQVGIGESPAFGSCRRALKFHRVLNECLDKEISIVEFRRPEKYAGVSDEKSYKQLTIAAELQEWDAVINVPKVKVHQQFMFTGATKNLYGCVTGKRKFVRHNLCKNDPVRFAKMVLANAAKASCHLHIGDGIQAMHVKGPRGGKPFPLGKIIISDDFLTHDWLVCRLIGLDPAATPLFKAAGQSQLAECEKACHTIVGNPGFKVAADFIQSYETDISFSPWHILRTYWRSLKFRLKNA